MTAANTSQTGESDPRQKTQQSVLASQRAKQIGENDEGFFARMAKLWPLGNKESAQQWWNAPSPAQAEHNVLSFLRFVKSASTQRSSNEVFLSDSKAAPGSLSIASETGQESSGSSTEADPYGSRLWYSKMVKLAGANRELNEFSVERSNEKPEHHLVMLHGYGAGLGFFYKNFEGLSRLPGWRLFALDLLGMGRSSRPPFRLMSNDRQSCISEAEDWFIDALEEWRVKRKIDQFTLMGHSLGGYMAVAYAIKYPGHLNKLILASPVGVPEDPRAVNAELPDPADSTIANEIVQDQEEDIKKATNPRIPEERKVGDQNNFMNARKQREKAAQNGASPPSKTKLSKLFTILWDANISPFSLVRWSGPLGPRLVSGWTSRRFSHLSVEESQALHTYAFSLMRMKGSGEYALAYILAPGAFARSPLIRRIEEVGRQQLPLPMLTPDKSGSGSSGNPREHGIPITFIYGENDWMDVAGGFAAEQKLKDRQAVVLQRATPDEKAKEKGAAKVLIIREAGHHVYLDGWEEFNQVMRDEMTEVSSS